jgi:hypothetical protein
MHAYFPALTSFPSLLGDMIADAINCIGFTWAASPAATELEALVMDWLVKCLDLPEKFLSSNNDSFGGGVLQVCNASNICLKHSIVLCTQFFCDFLDNQPKFKFKNLDAKNAKVQKKEKSYSV